MMNFDTELDVRGVQSIIEVSETVKVIRHTSSQSMAYVGKPDAEWQWGDLRDYVVHEIVTRFGSFERTPTVEYGIFNSFLKRWGLRAPAIARYAFEICGGYWGKQPITISRFCKNADAHFALPISERLV